MVARAKKDEAEKDIENFEKTPDNIFKFVKSMQKAEKDVKVGQCIRDERGRLDLSAMDRKRIWREQMTKIIIR